MIASGSAVTAHSHTTHPALATADSRHSCVSARSTATGLRGPPHYKPGHSQFRHLRVSCLLRKLKIAGDLAAVERRAAARRRRHAQRRRVGGFIPRQLQTKTAALPSSAVPAAPPRPGGRVARRLLRVDERQAPRREGLDAQRALVQLDRLLLEDLLAHGVGGYQRRRHAEDLAHDSASFTDLMPQPGMRPKTSLAATTAAMRRA